MKDHATRHGAERALSLRGLASLPTQRPPAARIENRKKSIDRR